MPTDLSQIPVQEISGDKITSGTVAAARIDAAMATDAELAAAGLKELFFPVNAGTEISFYGSAHFPVAICNALNEWGSVCFMVPAGFTSIVAAKMVVIPRATQAAADYNANSQYGAVGEAYNTHSGVESAATYNVTDGVLFEVDIAGILASLAAGDFVAITMAEGTAGHDVNILGIRFKWN